jgi:hypothetical protein
MHEGHLVLALLALVPSLVAAAEVELVLREASASSA